MKEAEMLEYGKLAAKDYIPGAEVLPETSEVQEQQTEQGMIQLKNFYLVNAAAFWFHHQ